MRTALVVGAAIGAGLLAAYAMRARSRARVLYRRTVPRADIEAAIVQTTRELLGETPSGPIGIEVRSEILERAALAWADLESGFNPDAVAVSRAGRAWGLYQLLDRYFLPLAIERGLLPADARPSDLTMPVVNMRLGIQNVLRLLAHEDNPGTTFEGRFLAARSRALGCGFRCTCGPSTCARVVSRATAALRAWNVV